MNGTRRLLTWFGAGMYIVVGAPAAYASADVQTGPQQRDSVICGGSPADFAGAFREVQYPEVGYVFDTAAGTVTGFYRGAPVARGVTATQPGSIRWTFDRTAGYQSRDIECGDVSRPTRVTEIIAESSSAVVSLAR